jgi:hypothetical protein
MGNPRLPSFAVIPSESLSNKGTKAGAIAIFTLAWPPGLCAPSPLETPKEGPAARVSTLEMAAL